MHTQGFPPQNLRVVISKNEGLIFLQSTHHEFIPNLIRYGTLLACSIIRSIEHEQTIYVKLTLTFSYSINLMHLLIELT